MSEYFHVEYSFSLAIFTSTKQYINHENFTICIPIKGNKVVLWPVIKDGVERIFAYFAPSPAVMVPTNLGFHSSGRVSIHILYSFFNISASRLTA